MAKCVFRDTLWSSWKTKIKANLLWHKSMQFMQFFLIMNIFSNLFEAPQRLGFRALFHFQYFCASMLAGKFQILRQLNLWIFQLYCQSFHCQDHWKPVTVLWQIQSYTKMNITQEMGKITTNVINFKAKLSLQYYSQAWNSFVLCCKHTVGHNI